MGRMHANVYSQLEQAELVAVVDIKPEVGSKFGGDFGVPSYTTLDEALASVECNVVDICLPTWLHKDFTVAAAKAGKNIFCEKPMALNVSECDEMIAACDAAGVRLSIGHCIRFWPEYAKLKEIVVSGSLGKLLSVNLTRYGAFPSWSSDNWLADPEKSGGGALDMHIHDTDFALYLLGTPQKLVSFGTRDQRGVGQIFTTMTFGDQIIHLEGGWNLPRTTPFKHAFRAIFERGAAIMDAGPLTIHEDGKEAVVPEFEKMEAAGGGNISDLGGYFFELKYYVDKLISGEPFEVTTPDSSKESVRVALEEISQVP